MLFSLYGNQYEAREEHLLLTMFQVGLLTLNLSESPRFVMISGVVDSPPGLAFVGKNLLTHLRRVYNKVKLKLHTNQEGLHGRSLTWFL